MRTILRSAGVAAAVLCGCVSAPHVAERNSTCAPNNRLVDRTVGVIECRIDRLDSATALSSADVSRNAVHHLVTILRETTALDVADRTRVGDILREHALGLAGLRGDAADTLDMDLGDLDYLLALRLGALSVHSGLQNSGDGVLDASLLYRCEVRYVLHLELLEAADGTVAWAYSRPCVHTAYEHDKRRLNPPALLERGVDRDLRAAVRALRCDSW